MFCSNKYVQIKWWYFAFNPFQQIVAGLCLSYVFIIEKCRQIVCFNCLCIFPSQQAFSSNLKYKVYGY